MKNNILHFLFILSSFHSIIYAEGFIIKLATYSNQEQLSTQIKRLDKDIQNSTTLREERNFYKLFSTHFDSKEEALHFLPKYKKIFTDAYIMIDTYNKINTHNENNEPKTLVYLLQNTFNNVEDNTTIQPTKKILYPTKDPIKRISIHSLLANKTYYLCPHKITAPSEKLLIQADFTDTNVSYNTLMGKMPHLEMEYMIKNNRLYMINNHRVSISQFSTIDKILFEYMVVARWMKGKKIHQMRYYKREEDARSYIDSIHLD